MFRLEVMEDLVRVPPDKFGKPLKETINDILRAGYEYNGRLEGGYEGKIDKDQGALLVITDIKSISDGSVIPGDGSAFHNVVFEALVYRPELHEIIDGEVVEIVEFGAFIRFGPLDGLIHVSQITDDFIIYDKKRGALVGKESNKTLEVGDKVRARVVAVSLNSDKAKESKINLTMRQPGLGKFEWLKEAKEKGKEKPEKKEVKKKEKKAKEPEKKDTTKPEKESKKEKGESKEESK
ncbi:MAG: DNA-directed RNA polymerase [Candidatus Hydrothermarchaeaceae archaeon]